MCLSLYSKENSILLHKINNLCCSCHCRDGYSGDGMTCKNVDECSIQHGRCGPNEICRDTIGSFTCICRKGFTKDEFGNCKDINECLSNDGFCSSVSDCKNTIGGYECSCPPGYYEDGNRCYRKYAM